MDISRIDGIRLAAWIDSNILNANVLVERREL